MSQSEKICLGDVLFQDIDENDYLNELYKNILYNYAITTLRITKLKQLRSINVDDALRFANLLSKSTHAEKSDAHKIWAHEIITMLLTLYPEDEIVRYYAGAVLTSTGNFMGRRLIGSNYPEPAAMDELFSIYLCTLGCGIFSILSVPSGFAVILVRQPFWIISTTLRS